MSQGLIRSIVPACALVLTPAALAGSVLFVDDDAPPGGDGSSWRSALRHLADGLDAAGWGGASEIRVAQGLYLPDRSDKSPDGTGDRAASFWLPDGVAVRGGFAGLGAADPDARDIAAFESILSGDLAGNDDPADSLFGPTRADNSFNVVGADGAGPGTLLDGLTVAAGIATNDEGWGGGVYVEDSTITIQQCTLRDCAARYGGAGVYFWAGNLTLTGCTISGNRAGDGEPANGGGVYVDFAGADISGCVFSGNSATNGGGGLAFQTSWPSTVRGCSFQGNQATGPSAGGTGGGGILAYGALQEIEISSCVFRDNVADGSAFGDYGVGAAIVLGSLGYPTRVSSCLFAGNVSYWSAAGIWDQSPADNVVVNCTIHGNVSLSAPGAGTDGVGRLDNCILWGNVAQGAGGEAAQVAEAGISEPGVIASHSCIEGLTALAGPGNTGADPMFVDAARGDLRLAAGSPLIDAGHNWRSFVGAPTDLAGNSRVADDPASPDTGCGGGGPALVDMGAYEMPGTPVELQLGDATGDGVAGIVDLLAILARYGELDEGCEPANFNLNERVWLDDLLILLEHWR